MEGLFEVIRLLRDIIKSNIFIHTSFWIVIGLIVAWMAGSMWNSYQEERHGAFKIMFFVMTIVASLEIIMIFLISLMN